MLVVSLAEQARLPSQPSLLTALKIPVLKEPGQAQTSTPGVMGLGWGSALYESKSPKLRSSHTELHTLLYGACLQSRHLCTELHTELHAVLYVSTPAISAFTKQQYKGEEVKASRAT